MTAQPLTKIAVCYDFDGTLSTCNMQESCFIPQLGLTADEFWNKVSAYACRHDIDRVLAYMNLMLNEAKDHNIPLTRENLRICGRNVPLFPGLLGWFDRIKGYADRHGIELEHYIISSGSEEIIEGSPISRFFKKIFACKFVFENGQAVSAGTAVNYTNKTQFLFRINKGILNYHENRKVNQYTPKEEKIIPMSNFIYIGDGETDVPCMKMVKGQGGTAVSVYNPERPNAREIAVNLLRHNRADYMAPADYSENSLLDEILYNLISRIEADTRCRLLKEKIFKNNNIKKD